MKAIIVFVSVARPLSSIDFAMPVAFSEAWAITVGRTIFLIGGDPVGGDVVLHLHDVADARRPLRAIAGQVQQLPFQTVFDVRVPGCGVGAAGDRQGLDFSALSLRRT